MEAAARQPLFTFGLNFADGRGYSLKDYGIKYVGVGIVSIQAYSILFNTVSGVIRNLNIDNVLYKAQEITALIHLYTYSLNGLIENCKSNGRIKALSKGNMSVYYAGFVYSLIGVSTVNNCENNIDIDGSLFTSNNTYIAAIARLSSGISTTIVNCINNGNIRSSGESSGIISAINAGVFNLENNLNTGIITSTDITSSANANAGGILAYLNQGTVTFKNNTNLGNVENSGISTNVGAGGIIGYASGTSFLYNNTNSGNITANSTTEGNAGGIIGFTNGTASLYNNTNTGIVESKGIYAGGAIGRAETGSRVTLDGNLNYGKVISTEVAGRDMVI